MALYGLIAVKIKTAWYLGEACRSSSVAFLGVCETSKLRNNVDDSRFALQCRP